nr:MULTISPECIES: YibE/F family protein [unclassified Meiothermus]
MRVGQRVWIRQVEGQAFLVEPFRLGYLYALLGIFVLAVLFLGRGKGLRGLIGTAASLLVLVYGVVPLITRGANPLLVTFAGAFGILLLSIYFVHGVGRKTTAALLGTSLAVAVSLGLAALFTRWMGFTGLTSEEAFLARFALQNLDLVSLYLAGVVVGALGALNDVTVTQASVIQALALANPRYSLRELYQRGMAVGFDHIGSLVNTLVLAYSAGSLPLMLLIQQGDTPLRFLLNQEPFMAEFVSMLVGSLGLVLAVPFTTFVAASFFHGGSVRYIEQRWPKPQREGRSWVQDMLEKDEPE